MTTQADIPSSSALLPPIPKHDVFLSSSAEETLTDHLCAALKHKGISTFRDGEQVERGKAIEGSSCAIVVLSGKCTNPWCLDAIEKIVERKQVMDLKILPVFHGVDPSDVREQKGDHFGEAFLNHEKSFKDEPEKVRRWRRSLSEVADLSGWHVQNGFEAQVIEDITETILNQLDAGFEGLVGMDLHVNKMRVLLQVGGPGLRVVGICGMGGVGKTTIAGAVYARICSQFEYHVFLGNVRELSGQKGIVGLQEKFLSYFLEDHVNVSNEELGRDMIRHALHNKMILLVLDDVNQLEQLEALCDHSWFGSGSRIIITSRYRDLLRGFEVDGIYKVDVLSEVEGLQLFCSIAFKGEQDGGDFLELCKKFVNYAAGLPLAIKVLASHVCCRPKEYWVASLEKLKRYPDENHEITSSVLRLSFDGLDEVERAVFLDIACFFKGENIDCVRKILGDYCPDIVIDVLQSKALVTVVGRNLGMHDLIQEMGHNLVRAENIEKPGKRSRLWIPQDIIHVLNKNEGSSAVQGIALDIPKTEMVGCNSEVFSEMDGLRILQIQNVHMKEGPRYLSQELILLVWSGYPAESLPQNFNPKRLCKLNLCYSMIKRLWTGRKDMPKLTDINLSNSRKLTGTPDFTCAPWLETLILEDCKSLAEIHPSIGFLNMLTCLNLKGCISLETLPSKLEMKSLQVLVLSGCSKVKKIPDFVEPMECLSELYLDETAIEQLPTSVRYLTGLTVLKLRDCKNLKSLPSDIGNLKSLKLLNICGCSKLETLPDSLGKIDCLEELDAGGTSIINIPSSISRLENLEVLSLCGCKGMSGNMTRYPLSFLLPISGSGGLRSLRELNLSDCKLQEGSIPEDFGCLFPLISLNLSKNNFVSLPKSIRQLSKLCNLNLESCKTLQKLPDLSPSLIFSVQAAGSISQERLSSCFNLINCSKLVINQPCNNLAFPLLWRFLQGIPSARNRFETIIPGCEISELFSDHSWGPIISMELPQQWQNNKFIGYAFGACFVIRRELPVPAANRLGKWKFGSHNTANGLRCEVKPENRGATGWCPSFACSQELDQIESEHLWLSFVSGDYFGTAWRETCHKIEFTFKTLGTGMEVKKCGVRLIYEQDLDLFAMRR